MNPKLFMVIAGEASGDLLAAELVRTLRVEVANAEPIGSPDYQPLHTSLAPRFFGAGGRAMAAAGVDLALDLTAHSVTGLSDVLQNYLTFRRLFRQLFRLALERKPDAIICVDFSGFNRRFARAIRTYVRKRHDWFHDWNPKLIQYVSPQVWASRPKRAWQMARDYDLVLSIFPFEKEWYAQRVPQLRVEFVGHPMLDRYSPSEIHAENQESENAVHSRAPSLLLLPGSRAAELKRHLPVMFQALALIRNALPNLAARMVLPDSALEQQAKNSGLPASLKTQTGGLPQALAAADVAIASTGTVTMECAFFGVPTVALYKTSWLTYQIGKRIVTVPHLAMPNLLAKEEVFPEFIQDQATPENIARAALALLRDEPRRNRIKSLLAEIIAQLGGPGATQKAARLVTELMMA
jgi:lipid-A-disaccharide synthase